ncbi:Cof-type HAD-IIB family hydrolase [Niallia taxi]|uniref:HAD family phosphatase n=1 Tax=Niallia taxi TaxID=2499688 RepID=A0A437KEX1_9BACI|nr:Cof-type HAD-IIB family hydrolase [Niallia taxi]MCM3215790.1 Cof-type HAD-IIB family hydrolase [Niallia taxi]MDK8641043.1 Cof-type HAD-IIB family hydrolase [Niallia taxi]MED4038436.1 Cof-type HAD-IIB family hydrolase [Niallia taxi]MED4056769.1 Cof-type HAD-IIB family hydrolase [Niallia taxi]MED4117316.1 Cof-type HAD-IIB family hydrolase [Niallia taxi]
MNDIKVIIMDVDGTLTNNEKVITAKTKEVLVKAQKAGAILVLASGRPTSGLRDIAKELEMEKHHGLLVSFNGSKVVDCETNEVLFNETMSVDEGQEVLEHMKKFEVIPMIDKDNYMFVNDVFNNEIDYNGNSINIIKYESRGGKFNLCEIEDLAAFADYPLNKILTAGSPDYLQQHYKEMMEPFKEKLNCVFTAPFYFEFTAQGIDKAKALDTVLIPRGYKREEMIAFGDGHNDATMVEYAGIGVAMANAVDDLKAVADEVTRSNEEDGIAYTLSKYFN